MEPRSGEPLRRWVDTEKKKLIGTKSSTRRGDMGKKGASGGIKAKGKKNGGSLGGGGGKLKKNSQFKSLKKQQTAVVAVEKKKKPSNNKKSGGEKRRYLTSDEVRNFNERMSGQKKRSEAVQYQAKNLSVAPPTFVMPAPTFSFGAPPPVKEVEGFQGFITTMTAPKDTPQQRVDPAARRVKPVQPAYQGSNVFAVLEVDDEEEQLHLQHQRLQQQHQQRQQLLLQQQQQQETQRLAAMAAAAQRPPPFLQPATFAFQAVAAPTFQFKTQQTAAAVVVAVPASAGDVIDPDL